MDITSEHKMDSKNIKDDLKKLKPSKVLDAKQHKGKVKWGEDAVSWQKKKRDEWK